MSECYYCGCENDRFHNCREKQDYHRVEFNTLSEKEKESYLKQKDDEFYRNITAARAFYDRILKKK